MGSSLEPHVRNEAVNEIRHQYLTAERARSMLNWSPLFTLEQGLARTLGWYKEYLRDSA
jgi:CDP-glucose 4,6-dehydratase